MIEFHKDNLVPPELCRLLYRAVPKEYHVPIRFNNRREKDIYADRGRVPLGSVYFEHGKWPVHININLNPIYKEVDWRRVDSPQPIARSSALWRLLVQVCLHEFGHVATRQRALKMNHHAYFAERGYGKVYEVTERLADRWMGQRLARIVETDPRMGQPAYLTGYLGARLLRWQAWAKAWPGYYPYIMERRCQRSGGQLTAGDVLRRLHINPRYCTGAYALLRRASEGVGIDYVDGAGRRHKLYTWGDVPVLAARLETAELHPKTHPVDEYDEYDLGETEAWF